MDTTYTNYGDDSTTTAEVTGRVDTTMTVVIASALPYVAMSFDTLKALRYNSFSEPIELENVKPERKNPVTAKTAGVICGRYGTGHMATGRIGKGAG